MIHLPSLAQLDGATQMRIWLCTEPTDMRRGVYRLAEQAEQVTRQDPQSGYRFVFRRNVRQRRASASCPAVWHASM